MESRRVLTCRADHLEQLIDSVLHEQQAGGANLFPGGSTEEDLELPSGSWKCGFRFPEQGVGI